MANQPTVVTQTIEKAVRLLEATGCEYKIIATTGEQYGRLEVVTKKHRTRNLSRPYGELTKYFEKFVKYDSAIGDVIEVPVGTYPAEDIRSGVCAKLSAVWGKGTYVSVIEGDRVQILRTA